MRIYVYWSLNNAGRWKRFLLNGVKLARRITTRLPHRPLFWICHPVAAGAWLTFVLPYRCLSRFAPTKALAESLPLKQYAQYPFEVILNDQFDRFSAPLERRYTSDEVRTWLNQTGLEEVDVTPYSGWLGNGRKPATVADVVPADQQSTVAIACDV